MWIDEICIEHFGLCKGLSIRDLSPGLNLLVGPNEAGKSSVVEFMRSVFFGFRYRNPRVNTYEPPDGASRSGWLNVRVPGGDRFRMQRTERPGVKEGMLTVCDESGKGLESSVIPLFRPGMDRRLYENLFAFDLDRLRHLDKKTLRGRIVSAALGSLDVNPLDVAKKLDERLKTLGKRTKGDSEALYAIHAKIEDLDKHLHSLAQKPALYTERRQDLDTVHARRQEVAAEIHAAELSHHQVALVQRYETEWQRLKVLEQELQELADASTFPANGVNRLDSILERIRDTEEVYTRLEKDLAHNRERLKGTAPDETVLAHADRIHSLARQSHDLRDRPGRLERERAAMAQASEALDRELRDLGKEWTRQKLVNADPSVILEQRIRSVAESWQTHRERIRFHETRMLECADSLERLEEKCVLKEQELRDNAPFCRGYLEPKDRDKLRQWKDCAKRVEDLQERLQEKKLRMASLVDERRDLTNRLKDLDRERTSLIPAALFWPIVLLWGVAGAVLGWGGFRGTDAGSFVFAVVGVLMVTSLPLVVAWKIRNDRGQRHRLAREKDALKRQLDAKVKETIEVETGRRQFMHHRDQLDRHMQKIAASVLANPLAGLRDVETAERGSAEAEEWVRKGRSLEESVKEIHRDMEQERQRKTQIHKDVDHARGELNELKLQWQELLADEGFDRSLDPEPALEVVRRLRDLKTKERGMVERAETLAALSQEWNEFELAVSALGADLGVSVSGVSALDLVERWSRAETEARESLARLMRLQEEGTNLLHELSVLTKKIQDAQEQARALMSAAGMQDEEAFRSQAQRHQRREILDHERRVLLQNVTAGFRDTTEDELRARMDRQDWDANRAALAMLQGKLQRLRAESEELASRKGRLEREIQAMEAEEETEKLLAEREELHARLGRGMEEWLTFRLARRFLEQTLDVYATEKQPKVLDMSSGFLRSIAGGSFSRILLPLDRDHVLVERPDGTRVAEEHLSRGTLEQVYLSLRLAHIAVYHTGDLAFPLMMDDVLVNFDPQRGSATASTLARFARETGVQILFFTCHPTTVDLFPGDTRIVAMESLPLSVSPGR
jgi:uncharacterized protein YhaN